MTWPELFQDPTDEYLDAMMSEAPGPINFTMFLTLFGERLQVRPSISLSPAAGFKAVQLTSGDGS